MSGLINNALGIAGKLLGGLGNSGVTTAHTPTPQNLNSGTPLSGMDRKAVAAATGLPRAALKGLSQGQLGQLAAFAGAQQNQTVMNAAVTEMGNAANTANNMIQMNSQNVLAMNSLVKNFNETNAGLIAKGGKAPQ